MYKGILIVFKGWQNLFENKRRQHREKTHEENICQNMISNLWIQNKWHWNTSCVWRKHTRCLKWFLLFCNFFFWINYAIRSFNTIFAYTFTAISLSILSLKTKGVYTYTCRFLKRPIGRFLWNTLYDNNLSSWWGMALKRN